MLSQIISGAFALVILYLYHANRAISTAPPEATKLSQKPWTAEQRRDAYKRVQESPTDVKPFLFSKRDRRYIVVGGSGLVGGYIVQHLLMRGEDPNAIRLVDLSSPTKEEIAGKVDFVQTDITSINSVQNAFGKAWPNSMASKPLTVFHCAAYILSQDRHKTQLAKYLNINVRGTENVLMAAREAGASIFVATSSGSVALRPASYFPYPWQGWPKNILQIMPNAEPLPLDTPLEDCAACYTWSKMRAEAIVLKANEQASFMTGAIRPCHAIYGAAQTPSSFIYDYIRRGGAPSWIPNVITNIVSAVNVSVAHLAYENVLLNKTHPGGKGYAVTDPNPPIRYGDVYRYIEALVHPLTPCNFPYVPHILMLLMAYVIEQYVLLRNNGWNWLPQLPADLLFVQPGVFQLCTLHTVYDDSAAKNEIGYNAPLSTLEGVSLAVLDWNERVEKSTKSKVDQGKGGDIKVQDTATHARVPHI